MSKIKISVIIPVYNAASSLIESLNSIINQTLKEIEIICVDDGSVDDSLSVLNDIAKNDSRVKVFSKKNEGSGIARNFGLSKANGEFIAFLDADDYIVDENAYLRMYEAAIKENLNMVSANLQVVMPNEIIYETADLKHIYEKKLVKSEDYGIPWFFGKNIFRRSFLVENDINFPKFLRGQDPVFLVKVLTNLDYFLQIPINYYSYNAPLINKINSSLKYLDYFNAFCDIFNILGSNDKFKNMFYIFSEKLIQMSNRDVHITNHSELLNLLNFMNTLSEIFIKFDDNSLLNRVYSSFDKIISKLNLDDVAILAIENKNFNSYSDKYNILPYDFVNESKPKISVIVPFNDSNQYLEGCLDSIVNQTFNDIEIICVNQGFSNNSVSNNLEIIYNYSKLDQRIKILKSPNNDGIAKNTGLNFANGDYIYFMDSDDWIDFKALELMYFKIINNNGDILIFNVVNYLDGFFAEDNSLNIPFFKNQFKEAIFSYKDCYDILFILPKYSFNKLYNLNFLKKINAKFEFCDLFENISFFFKVFLSANKIVFSEDYIYFRRILPKLNHVFSDKIFKDLIKISNCVLDICKEDITFYENYYRDIYDFKINLIRYFYLFYNKEFTEEDFNLLKNDFENLDIVFSIKNIFSNENYLFFNSVIQSNNLDEFNLIFAHVQFDLDNNDETTCFWNNLNIGLNNPTLLFHDKGLILDYDDSFYYCTLNSERNTLGTSLSLLENNNEGVILIQRNGNWFPLPIVFRLDVDILDYNGNCFIVINSNNGNESLILFNELLSSLNSGHLTIISDGDLIYYYVNDELRITEKMLWNKESNISCRVYIKNNGSFSYKNLKIVTFEVSNIISEINILKNHCNKLNNDINILKTQLSGDSIIPNNYVNEELYDSFKLSLKENNILNVRLKEQNDFLIKKINYLENKISNLENNSQNKKNKNRFSFIKF